MTTMLAMSIPSLSILIFRADEAKFEVRDDLSMKASMRRNPLTVIPLASLIFTVS